MHRRALLAALPVLAFPAHAQSRRSVRVLYAGSLVELMERGLGPAFDRTGLGVFQGFSGGSGALVNQIKGRLRQADLFISADPRLDDRLAGPANGDWVRWHVVFARSPLVIGYRATSRFAAALRAGPWWRVLAEPGIRIGRTDPATDPKGALTVELLTRAERLTGQPGLARRILRPDQVRPEPALVGALQSGELDAGFFYLTETTALALPAIALPPDLAPAAHYALAVLERAPNPDGAAAFGAFLLGPDGQGVMRRHGLDVLSPAIAAGDTGAIPPAIRRELAPAAR